MTPRPSPRRFHVAVIALAATAALGSPVISPVVRAQDPAPGTPDATFVLDRVRNTTFIPNQSNFTPFALALQAGQDPVQPGNPNIREIPAGQTKLLVAGDAATLIRTFLTQTVRAATIYDANGVPVTTYTSPFQPGDYDPVFFASPATSNGFGDSARTTYSLAVQDDGGVLVGGLFGPTALENSVFRNQPQNFILLNFNGDTEITVDANNVASKGPFNANLGSGASDSVLAILRRTSPVPDGGSILLGGQFTRFNKQNRGRVVQILPDGTGDVSFNTNLGSGANGIVYSLAEAVGPGVDALGVGFFGLNGQTYVCGDFDRFNNNGPGKLVRLNADGTLDGTFAPQIDGRAIAVAVQPNGQVLVGGDLDRINGTDVNNLARLNFDGSLDPVFQANVRVSVSFPSGIPPTAVYVVRVQPDGRILVGGNYLQLDGSTRRYLGRLNADGTLDTSFDAGNTLSNAAQSVVYAPRDASRGGATDLIYSQTRADRKQVPGDNGFFPSPVRRLFGDNTSATVASFPVGAPLVRIGADGPLVTVGDLQPTTNADLFNQPVPNPGTPGLIRITRDGDTSTDLVVRVKVAEPAAPAPGRFNVGYRLQQLFFTPVTTVSSSGTSTTIINTTAEDIPFTRFNVVTPEGLSSVSIRLNVVIPAGQSSASILVVGQADQTVQAANETVRLKLRGSAVGSYGKRADQNAATVTILPNNL